MTLGLLSPNKDKQYWTGLVNPDRENCDGIDDCHPYIRSEHCKSVKREVQTHFKDDTESYFHIMTYWVQNYLSMHWKKGGFRTGENTTKQFHAHLRANGSHCLTRTDFARKSTSMLLMGTPSMIPLMAALWKNKDMHANLTAKDVSEDEKKKSVYSSGAVGWVRHFDAILKYCNRSWVWAPAAAVSQYQKLASSTFLTQPTAQPSMQI